MDSVGNDGNVLCLLEVGNHMKGGRARVHENGISVCNKARSLRADGILKINVCNGSDHIVLAAV